MNLPRKNSKVNHSKVVWDYVHPADNSRIKCINSGRLEECSQMTVLMLSSIFKQCIYKFIALQLAVKCWNMLTLHRKWIKYSLQWIDIIYMYNACTSLWIAGASKQLSPVYDTKNVLLTLATSLMEQWSTI